MLTLSPDDLDAALSAINHHGYGDFFPDPPELKILNSNWAAIRDELSGVDLDTWDGYPVLSVFAPKSRVNVRRVQLIHPYDLVLYTGLVLALGDGINSSRLPARDRRVFSYRADTRLAGTLYDETPNFRQFRETVAERITGNPEQYVGMTDIADFYPRIYQHRLVNALQAANDVSKSGHIRVLEKMLNRFSDGVSYGIPIGSPASRPLGEALLIDVDSSLRSFDIDFLRFTDDFVIFAGSPEDAEYGVRMLGETLILNHGLTLQTAKTKIMKASEYAEKYLTAHDEKEDERRKLLEIVGTYDETISYEEMNEEQRRELDAFNLSEMLTDALAEGENVDFREVSFILGRLSALEKPELVPIVIENLERLSPVAHSVASFFRKFSNLDYAIREAAAEALLRPIVESSKYATDYYAIWVLSVFADEAVWNHADSLLRIFREARSDTVRRFASLALGTSGSRAHVVAVRQYLQSASPLARTAMMLATKKMGNDERKYFRQSLRLHDSFEKLCMSS